MELHHVSRRGFFATLLAAVAGGLRLGPAPPIARPPLPLSPPLQGGPWPAGLISITTYTYDAANRLTRVEDPRVEHHSY
jgi:hypothetical protein